MICTAWANTPAHRTARNDAFRLSRHKVIVKRLNAIQNLGAMNVLCTDKTGTLTQDKDEASQMGRERDRALHGLSSECHDAVAA